MLDLIAGEYIVAGQKLHVTSSLGISIYPDHGRDSSLLLRLADKAMYDAKQAGRNTYRLFPAPRSVDRFAMRNFGAPAPLTAPERRVWHGRLRWHRNRGSMAAL